LTAAAREALGAHEPADALRRKIVELRPREKFERALAGYEQCGGDPKRYGATPIRNFLSADAEADKVAALTSLFLTGKGDARQDFASRSLDKIDPSIREFYNDAQKDFLPLHRALVAAIAFEDTRALYAVLERIFGAYQQLKNERAALDFDDLIVLTRRLLSGEDAAAWVLYKLDHGLDHILLDEAQDTGPDAWDVIERPLEEFLSGKGMREIARTFFAVGDKKQSIYSFQGADAELFDVKSLELGGKLAAAGPFENVQLRASFRSTAPVLAFVDRLFARQEVWDGVSDAPPEHLCVREGMAGSVEVWPLAPREDRAVVKAWDAPFDQTSATNPKRALAEAVAQMIAGWLATREMLVSQGRPIAAGDVMILVQKRDALFHEMIRALGARGVPVAGADRMKLVEDQGVLDLLSFARAALFKGDDLSLAETLKGPFFDVSEDSLYDLAHAREGSLWNALLGRRHERPEWANAAREIAFARGVALKDGPVSFFMHLLETGAPSGWKRIASRLGAPSREPVEEFLRLAIDFEAAHPRSLRLFLHAVAASDAEANRDSAESRNSVRVMTAHKAKGLEAPIVFILDAHAPPKGGGRDALFVVDGPGGARIPLLAVDEGKLAPALVAAADQRKEAAWSEYRRLLYVAATRAEDRLFICGHQHGNSDPAKPDAGRKTWHALALDAMGADTETDEEKFGGRVRRIASPQSVPPIARSHGEATRALAALPAFLTESARPEARSRRLSPSALTPEEDAAYAPGRREDAFLRGRILHRLLELLPEVEPEKRADAASRLARRLGGKLGDAACSALAGEALAVLDDPQFAPVFSPHGLAEAAIGGAPKGVRTGLALSGQIDRLVILENRILIVDYKTNRPPPVRFEDVPPGYVAQLAAYRALLQEIYPSHQIEAALLWTYDARLMPVPAAALDKAHALTLA
jgi:ATP-dependent helicase/nuclease subunit A